METITFRNDNDVVLKIPTDSPNLRFFISGVNNEIYFRLIHTYLIKSGHIKGNIIDLGSFVGDNTLPWAKNIEGIVYAIDPYPAHCDFIKEMCKINEIDNVIVFQTAISDKNEILTTNGDLFHCEFLTDGTQGKNKADAVSLDHLLKEGLIKDVDYVHLDVEGMEAQVISGATELIKTCRPIISFEQHMNTDRYDLLSIKLIDMDYKVFLINEMIPANKPDCRNFLAFPNEKYTEDISTHINTRISHNLLNPVTKVQKK